jgi:hypothetical protein
MKFMKRYYPKWKERLIKSPSPQPSPFKGEGAKVPSPLEGEG